MWAKLFLLQYALTIPVFAMPLKFEEGSIISDSQVECFFETVCAPAFEILGDGLRSKIHFHLVNSEAINAFATKSGHIFVNIGIFLMADTPEEVIGVVFHEIGHVACDHITKAMDLMKSLEMRSLVFKILAGVAAGMGALSSKTGMGGLLPGILGGSTLIDLTMLTQMMHFSRAQEGSADQFALRVLRELKWSLKGFATFMEKMVKISGGAYFPMYLRTHPCSTERLSTIQDAQRRYSSTSRVPQKFYDDFFKIKAKLLACTTLHSVNSLEAFQHRLSGIPKAYHLFAHSIFLHRKGKTQEALKALHQFEAIHTPDAFTWELRAQILFESGHVAEALKAIHNAVKLRSKDFNIKTYAAIIELETEHASEWRKSVKTLESAVFGGQPDPQLWYWLAIALGKLHRMGEMHLAMAECALSKGEVLEAKKYTKLALKQWSLERGRSIKNISRYKYELRARDLDRMLAKEALHD